MTKTMKVLTAAVSILVATACTESPLSPSLPDDAPIHDVERVSPVVPLPGTFQGDEGTQLLLTAASRLPAMASGWGTVDVLSFADPARVVGRSSMDREARRVNARLEAHELEPGDATTLWAVVFNNPAACVGECDDPDLFENPDTQADLLYVAGAVANERGSVQYARGIAQGDLANSIMPLFGLPAWGVIDAQAAEIHLIVRSHGQAIPRLRMAQTTTFNGGCTGFGSEFGTPGPNECVDLYFASHYAN